MYFPRKVIGIQVEIYLVIEVYILFQFLDPVLFKHTVVLLFCVLGCFGVFLLVFAFYFGLFLGIHAVIEILLFYFSELLLLVFGLQTSLFPGAFADYVKLGFWIKRVHVDIFFIIF